MLTCILMWVIIVLVVIFAIGVRVGQFMSDKGVPTPISDSPEYLSMMENMLLDQARSDRQNQLKSNQVKEVKK